MIQPILIDGQWSQTAAAAATFQATNPHTRQPLPDRYPISPWEDCDRALDASARAFERMRGLPRQQLANFIDCYADRIEARADAICQLAYLETALPIQPRLRDVELPRTTNQLRLAAAAVRSSSWCRPVIDTAANIRSMYSAMGPVAVFGPNNFPLAFGSISGGDFAAAVAAGNPVIAKANSSHPGTTRLLAVEAQSAATACDMPPGTVQLLYRLEHADGLRLAGDARLAAIGYTGSRSAGLKLKAAADVVGKPAYMELSSINPVLILPGAIAERGEAIADELVASGLLGTGQFCTSPGLVILLHGESTESFVARLVQKTDSKPDGILLSDSVLQSLSRSVETLKQAGAGILCGGSVNADSAGYSYRNTILRVEGEAFLSSPGIFQTEAFGNAMMLVIAGDPNQAIRIVDSLEGNLTGAIYSSVDGDDDALYHAIEPPLRQRVGRLLNDRMPTGVAVSPAMNHGGPFPATGHPGFTAVGMPDSILRFAMLQCYDNVRPDRLPRELRGES